MRDKSLPSSGQRFNKIEGKESGNPTKQMTYGEVISQANRQGDSLGQHCRNGALPWTAIKWWNGASCSRAAWCAWGWGRGQVVWVTDGGIQDCASSWCWTSDSTGTCVASLARQPPLAIAELFFLWGNYSPAPSLSNVLHIQIWWSELALQLEIIPKCHLLNTELVRKHLCWDFWRTSWVLQHLSMSLALSGNAQVATVGL